MADCRTDTFRSGGPGGQHQNKRDTGVRITHLASGAVGESREERSQLLNKRKAFRRMTQHPKFRTWVNLALMDESVLRIEYYTP
jgi:protein subunit release factor B